jgi:hypothetical protein
MMHTCTVDESSYDGNKQIEEWSRQLKIDTDEEKGVMGRNRIVIWSGDQLTASRIRGLKGFRLRDEDPYERLGWIEPIFGWFHLQMALAASLHKQYWVTIRNTRDIHNCSRRVSLSEIYFVISTVFRVVYTNETE